MDDLYRPYLSPGRFAEPSTAGLPTLWPGLPVSPEVLDYVPLDAQQRADMYAAHSGQADYWPIPLTLCTPKQ